MLPDCSLLEKLGISSGEESIEIWYSFSLDKPKPTQSIPQDEWISSISALSHILNEKAKTYVVTFFNGDLKVFSKNDNNEVLSVKQLHEDAIIEDSLFLRNDALDKKIVVTCSSKPEAALKISEIIHIAKASGKGKQYQINVLARSKEELGSESFKCLSNNPMNN